MNLKNSLITALGGMPKEEFEKTTNRVHGTDFLRYGTRGRPVLPPDWAEVKIADEDVYKGYPYAVIQKRANKVASLAKENLNTWVKPEALDIFQKKQIDPLHPYLKIIEDSTDFSTKQFWKTICIYLDLAGAYYLGVLRNKIPSKSLDKKNFPDLYSDVSQFILLNPYEIKRVVNNDGEVAGYLETKKDGRQREWPLHMIIPMRELNPFDSDKVWSMTDAAKEETYTLNQSGSYTRETLKGNLNAPGILTTDVILDDQKFADFAERVKLHTKGEPIFGNGAGSITWASMQQDLDKAALLDINEINRTALFAVSGTSKTALGIEQSGTTRETARVQTEQFISDTAQPRLEDIIDFLNLDYKKHYRNEYDKVGYWLEIQSAASRDYATETQATQMRQAQSDLAFSLMQKGYTMASSYDYAEGKIELSELELEKGVDKPINPEQPEAGSDDENTPPEAPQSPTSDDKQEDDTDTDETQNALEKIEGIEPHSDLKKSNSLEEVCTCGHDHGKVETYINELGEEEGKTLAESYEKFLSGLEKIQKETYKACVSKLNRNAFEESDIIGKLKKKRLTAELKGLIQNYWWILTPLLANSVLDERNQEYGENVKFVFTNALQSQVEANAEKVAEGHMTTILDDVLSASNKAYDDIVENEAAGLIIKAYRDDDASVKKYFEEQPTISEAKKAIRNTDILEENRKIYDRANTMALEGYKREDIIKAIRAEYNHLSKQRATLIAGNETSRAYAHSQYAADFQFLNSIGKIENAYKEWYSRRPENEKDKICPFCQQLIDMGPIPFTQNFVSKGDVLTVEQDGKVRNFVCNYEDISSGVLHPNCQCSYRLVFLDGKVNNEITSDGGNTPVVPSASDDSSNSLPATAKSINGGKGSGNFGHSGRPGLVGGSGDGEVLGVAPEFNGDKLTFPKIDAKKAFKSVSDGAGAWTTHEIDYASIYYGSGYHNINAMLRGEPNPVPGNEERYQNAIQVMKDRMEKSSLSQDTMVYRGVNIGRYTTEDQLPQVGDEISYQGFSSTSMNPYEAMGWGKRNADTPPAILAIRAKKGAKAIKRFNSVETELTLPPNAKLKVVGRHLARDVFQGEGIDTLDNLYVLECEYE